MIQRIQTVYLFVVFLNSVLIFFFPFCAYAGSAGSYTFHIFGMVQLSNEIPVILERTVPLLILNIVIGLISITTIFLFKKRMLQVKLGRLLLLLLTIFLAVLFYYSDKFMEFLPGEDTSKTYMAGTYLPVLSFIFTFLANRAIRRDEELVRSADRIR